MDWRDVAALAILGVVCLTVALRSEEKVIPLVVFAGGFWLVLIGSR